MQIIILGKNEKNAEIEKFLVDEGHSVSVAGSVSELGRVNGFAPIIVTEPPVYETPLIDGVPLTNLMDETAAEYLSGLKTSEKIVVLLDWFEETPQYIAAKAVAFAKRLADVKKEVVFLSKTVKSGYDGGEEAWRSARGAGVAFIKYESTKIFFNEGKDRFSIIADDGVFVSRFETPYLVSTRAREPHETKNILKKLRLYRKADGSATDIGFNDDRYFFGKTSTSRYGVYYINPLHTEPGNEKELKDALFEIISDIDAFPQSAGQPGQGQKGTYLGQKGTCGHKVRPLLSALLSAPEVDSGKCAFCYSCYRACPHGALEPDIEASAMKVVEVLCQACGTCVAICPGEAISRKDAEAPAAQAARCKIYLCENGAAQAFEEAFPFSGESVKLIGGKPVETEIVACGGSVGADKIAGDLANYDILVIACCIENACRHMDGEKRACKQAVRAAGTVQKAGIGNKRVEVINVSHAMKNVMRDRIIGIMEERP